MASNLPPAEHYQYFSHLFHDQKLIPLTEYKPLDNWEYPALDKSRLEQMFLTDINYIQNQNVLDLGCHTGFFSYTAKHFGAKSVHGINARQPMIDIANYAFDQLSQTDYCFECGDIEDLDFLKKVCANKDTLLLTLVLEHLRNPHAILKIITESNIQNLVFESTVFSDSGSPSLQYYQQSTDSAFAVYESNRKTALGCVPNIAWIDLVLYTLGWKIEHYTVENYFNKNWFATPNLHKLPPSMCKTAFLLATKF
jgi:SAM-dependent methyltransferase